MDILLFFFSSTNNTVGFFCLYMIGSRNNASVFNFCILFDGKMNLVDALGRSKLKVIFKSAGENKEKSILVLFLYVNKVLFVRSKSLKI